METEPDHPHLVLERPAPGVALLRLNRPEVRNALSLEMRRSLAEHLRALAEEPDTRAVILTGGDRAFAAGADVKAMATAGPMALQARGLHRLWQAIADFPKPLIAAVCGPAFGGGCELALHADIIVAGEGASFGQPEVKLGIMPGAGGTQRLVRALGKHRALRLLLTGEIIPARQAADWGLVTDLVPDAEVLPRALSLAERLAALPPLAVQHIKETVLAGADLPLSAALLLERRAFHMLFDTEDQKEGMAAFLEKRPPRFEGR